VPGAFLQGGEDVAKPFDQARVVARSKLSPNSCFRPRISDGANGTLRHAPRSRVSLHSNVEHIRKFASWMSDRVTRSLLGLITSSRNLDEMMAKYEIGESSAVAAALGRPSA
jgi:hypothetical protein